MVEANQAVVVPLHRPVARGIGLAHPALVAMPAALGGAAVAPTLDGGRGASRGAVEDPSGDMRATEGAAAWVARAVRTGAAKGLLEQLRRARPRVERGLTFRQLVVTGTLEGWHLRMALSSVTFEPVVNWDQRRGRTRGERLAVLQRAIDELTEGLERPGGWVVSSDDGGV